MAGASVISQRPSIEEVKIQGRSPESTQRVADWFRENYPQLAGVRVLDSEQEAIEDSDIVISGTSTSPGGPSGFPYFKREWIKPGALLDIPGNRWYDMFKVGLISKEKMGNIGGMLVEGIAESVTYKIDNEITQERLRPTALDFELH